MLRASILLSAAVLPLFSPSFQPPSPAAPAQAACPNLWPREPAVLYEVTGVQGGLNLIVYRDGFAVLATHPPQSAGGTIERTVIDPSAVSQLATDLATLGATTLCDVLSITAEVQVSFSTVTVLRGATEARAHTFSWGNSPAVTAAITQRLADFISVTFP